MRLVSREMREAEAKRTLASLKAAESELFAKAYRVMQDAPRFSEAMAQRNYVAQLVRDYEEQVSLWESEEDD